LTPSAEQAMNTVRSEVRAFIVRNFLFGQDRDHIDDTQSLLESGIVDSTGLLELVSFLEEHYEMTVQDADLHPGNLDSLNAIAAFVTRKRLLSSVTREA
jgi:acyl carrier protein